MEEVLASAQPDQAALNNLVADILLKRDNDKKEKRSVLFKAMLNEARYGASSPFKHRFSKEELLQLKAEALTTLLAELRGIQHEVYYTGPHPFSEVKKVLKEKHVVLDPVQPPMPAQRFREKATLQNQVIFVDFPTVQVELLLYSKGTSRFNLEEYLFAQWYNQYFGYGLSSIVYQEIREARALAYSAYCYAANPSHKKRSHYLQAYVGTQPDKLKEAVEAFRTILEEMPISSSQLAHARTSVLKQLAADRIAPAEIYWTWRSNRDKGFNEDLRKRVFQSLQEATPEDLLNYQKTYVKGRKYTWLVLGERSRVDFDYLRTIGKVKEMTIEEVFGY
jgi:predicted Zn-dependent peptidase